MGRGRAPCCEKVGLNKGSWTPEEDMRLMAYIRKYGHGNWRALPKQAGLLRCGKSCRLRWINYLRPDIKRGNFTKEEEDTIIKLHGLLGNKWSKIASCLPGRTDNEIKNVWNTHLKKRLAPKDRAGEPNRRKPEDVPSSPSSSSTSESTSNQGEPKSDGGSKPPNPDHEPELSADKIEIPIEPNLDIWDMLDDSLNSDPSPPSNEPSSSSSEAMHPLGDIPEIPIEPELWNMIDDDGEGEGLGSGPHQANPAATLVGEESGGGGESARWLAYLEKELDLWGGSEDNGQPGEVEGGDPVSSYFQAPSFPLDFLMT